MGVVLTCVTLHAHRIKVCCTSVHCCIITATDIIKIQTLNVTQIYLSTIYFILKQGYMFRLEVSHLQPPTTFSLPDALPTLGSHSVYICGIHFI